MASKLYRALFKHTCGLFIPITIFIKIVISKKYSNESTNNSIDSVSQFHIVRVEFIRKFISLKNDDTVTFEFQFADVKRGGTRVKKRISH